jgi:glycosyltransferase involved in cell wall biosynthesis
MPETSYAEVTSRDPDPVEPRSVASGDHSDHSRPQVLAISAQGPSDPAFRIRLELPCGPLEDRGLHLTLVPLFTLEQAREFRSRRLATKARLLASARRRLRHELLEHAATASTALVQRCVDPTPSLALERLAAGNRRLIYDIDDAVWLSGRQTMGHALGLLKLASRKVRWLAERADHVIAGNEILAEHLERYSRRVTVVPSLVDPSAYAVRTHESNDTVTLGWIGSPTTAGYLQRIEHVLARFAAQSSRRVRLIVLGGAAPQVKGVVVCERVWSPANERLALAEMDVGLMPLPDTPWSRGKCAYKALQYMASGIPPIADDVGVSAGVIAGAGWVAGTEGEWLEGLHTLADSPSLRARMGVIGRGRIEDQFSLERWVPVLVGVLRGG